MSSLMHKPTIEGMPAPASARQAPAPRVTSAPAFRPDFRRSLFMHPRLAAGVTAVVFVLLLAYALTLKPVYTAESLVYIEPGSAKMLGDAPSGFDVTQYESYLQQQMQTAQRLDILRLAVASLPAGVWQQLGPNPEAAAVALQSQLKIQRVTTSYQLSIGLKGGNAEKTAAIVNAVTRAYLHAGRKDELTEADQRSQLLDEEKHRIESELTQARLEQAQLGVSLGVANPSGETNPYDSQLDGLRTQLSEAREAHDLAAAQLAALSGPDARHASGLNAAANDLIAGDAGLSSMKATINQRRAVLSSQMAGLTPGNPIYKQDQEEIADLDRSLDTMTSTLREKAARSLQDKLRTDLERTGDVEARINAQLAHQTVNATSAGPRLQRASELAADIQRLTTRYATVDDALRGLSLETNGPGMVHLSLPAAVPASPDPNRKRLLEIAALPLAFLCGLMAAVVARKRDRRIYIPGDIEEILGFPPIALLPHRSEVSDAALDEYFLRLAAGIESAYRTSGARTFVVTAASPATKIQPLAQALQRKVEQLGIDGILVSVAEMFAARSAQHVEAHTRVSDAPARLDRRSDGPASSLFDSLRAEHDLIFVEAPCLLVSAETEYMARCSDVTVLIAECGATTREEMYAAGALLQRLNVNGVGAVLQGLKLRYAGPEFKAAAMAFEHRFLDHTETGNIQTTHTQTVHTHTDEPHTGEPRPGEIRPGEIRPAHSQTDRLQAGRIHTAQAQALPVAAADETAHIPLQQSVLPEDRPEEEQEPANRPSAVDSILRWHARPDVIAASADVPFESPAGDHDVLDPASKPEEQGKRAFGNPVVRMSAPADGVDAAEAQGQQSRRPVSAQDTPLLQEAESMSVKRNWVQKLFGHETKRAVSIVPERTEDASQYVPEAFVEDPQDSFEASSGLAATRAALPNVLLTAQSSLEQAADKPHAAILSFDPAVGASAEKLQSSEQPGPVIRMPAVAVGAVDDEAAEQVPAFGPAPEPPRRTFVRPLSYFELVQMNEEQFVSSRASEAAESFEVLAPRPTEVLAISEKPVEPSPERPLESVAPEQLSEAGTAEPNEAVPLAVAPRAPFADELDEAVLSVTKSGSGIVENAEITSQPPSPVVEEAAEQPEPGFEMLPQPLAEAAAEPVAELIQEELKAPVESATASTPEAPEPVPASVADFGPEPLEAIPNAVSGSASEPVDDTAPSAVELIPAPLAATPVPSQELAPEPHPLAAFPAAEQHLAEQHLAEQPPSRMPQETWVSHTTSRWDPIPPLRPAREPWRNERYAATAEFQGLQNLEAVWGAKNAGTADRWAAKTGDEPAEPEDHVLTRRWGLLSRFQLGETFNGASIHQRREGAEEAEAEPVGNGSYGKPRG